ncbi:hypothetical protein D030_4200A, partial [Vibrio parahaemolyticus AQ3810]
MLFGLLVWLVKTCVLTVLRIFALAL